MNHDQILGGLLGCGVVIALAIGLIAMYIRQGVELIRGWTVEKDAAEATQPEVDFVIDPHTGRPVKRDAQPAAKMPQIGIKR